DPRGRFLAERHHPVLRALAAPHVDELLLEVDVAEVETDGLRAPEPRGVHELDERAVPERERALALERLQLALDLLRPRRVRQPPRPPRSDPRVGDARGAERVSQERPHGRELPRDGGGGELAAAAARGAEVARELDEDAHVDVVELRPARLEPRAELADLDGVRAPCRRCERGRLEELRRGCAGVHAADFDVYLYPPATTRPARTTSRMRLRSTSMRTSASGAPSRTTRSAANPGSTAPTSARPSAAAEPRVAARTAAAAPRPPAAAAVSVRYASSSCRLASSTSETGKSPVNRSARSWKVLSVGTRTMPRSAISSSRRGSRCSERPCSTVSTPASTANRVPSSPSACAATRTPSRCAS